MKPQKILILFPGAIALAAALVLFFRLLLPSVPQEATAYPQRSFPRPQPSPRDEPEFLRAAATATTPLPRELPRSIEGGFPAFDAGASRFAATLHEIFESGLYPERESELTALYRDWVRHDLSGAIGSLDTASDHNLAADLRRHLLFAWAEIDPDAALQWTRTLPERDRELAATHLCLALAENSPAAAVEFARRHRIDEEASGILENLIARWAIDDLPAAHAWAREQAATDQRDEWIARIAFQRSRDNPADAVRIVLDDIHGERARDEAIISVLHQWATRDIEAAFAWVREFRDPNLLDRALSELEGILLYEE